VLAAALAKGGEGGGRQLGTVRFSRSGKYLLTAGRNSTVRLWDVRNGRC
jgi:WD40 repeat protein